MLVPTSRARVVAGALASLVVSTAGCSVQVHRGGADAAPAAELTLEPRAQRDAQQSLFRADLHRADSLDANDAGDVARWFAADAVYLYPGLPVLQGAEAVRTVLRAAGQPARVIRWQPLRVEVSRDGDFGYSVGYALRARPDSVGRVRLDRYQAAWVRVGGAWRIVAYSELPSGALPAVPLPAAYRYEAKPFAPGAAADAAAADRAFAADESRLGTGAAFAKWAAADAMLAGGGGELNVGRPAILRAFGEPVAGASLVWGPVFARGASSGDLAVTVGEAVATSPGADGKPVSRNTKYLTIWRRTSQGMRWVTDGGNPR